MELVSLPYQFVYQRTGAMNRRSRGFTLIEVLIAIMIGMILTSIAVRGFGDTSSRMATRQARNVFNGMAARARAHAIESGSRTILIADAQGDSVVLFVGGTVIENIRFSGEMGVDIQSSSTVTRICMSPRGFADPDCNSFSSAITIAFVQGAQTETIEILPLGQIRW